MIDTLSLAVFPVVFLVMALCHHIDPTRRKDDDR